MRILLEYNRDHCEVAMLGHPATIRAFAEQNPAVRGRRVSDQTAVRADLEGRIWLANQAVAEQVTHISAASIAPNRLYRAGECDPETARSASGGAANRAPARIIEVSIRCVKL
jgi:hypothetical protein